MLESLKNVSLIYQTKKQEDGGFTAPAKPSKKVDAGKESEDDPSKVGKLDLKATFGKLAAKHAPPKDDDDMKQEAKDKMASDSKPDKDGAGEEKEEKKSVRIKIPDDDEIASSSKGKK